MFVGAVTVLTLDYYQPGRGGEAMWMGLVFSVVTASIFFRLANWFFRDIADTPNWYALFGYGFLVALVMNFAGIRPADGAKEIAVVAVFGLAVGLVASSRVREAVKMAAVNVLLLPTPLFGAARIVGYVVLFAAYRAAEGMMFGFSPAGNAVRHGAVDSFGGTIFMAIVLAMIYKTLGTTLIGAWQSAGRMTSLRSAFKAATKGFPRGSRYHNGAFSGFAVDPAARTVVISAREMLNGTTVGQRNQLVTLTYDDVTDIGTVIPGVQWQGLLVGAGYNTLAQSAVTSLNDLTQQRIAGAFDTGVWFATRNGGTYLVQADEKKLPKLAEMLAKVIN
jgi:hypothetical protein